MYIYIYIYIICLCIKFVMDNVHRNKEVSRFIVQKKFFVFLLYYSLCFVYFLDHFFLISPFSKVIYNGVRISFAFFSFSFLVIGGLSDKVVSYTLRIKSSSLKYAYLWLVYFIGGDKDFTFS